MPLHKKNLVFGGSELQFCICNAVPWFGKKEKEKTKKTKP